MCTAHPSRALPAPQNLAPSSIAPWARAEIVFYTEHQEFNQYITEHADEMVKKLPREVCACWGVRVLSLSLPHSPTRSTPQQDKAGAARPPRHATLSPAFPSSSFPPAPPMQAQEDELDLLDEALFLLRTDDDNAAAQRAGQQSAEQELLDQYLEGTLPGARVRGGGPLQGGVARCV